jgi:hypothetical protein
MRKRIRFDRGIVRPLDPNDPRNLDDPSHKEQWLEFARAIGRMEAREEFERLHGKGQQNHGATTKARYRTT